VNTVVLCIRINGNNGQANIFRRGPRIPRSEFRMT